MPLCPHVPDPPLASFVDRFRYASGLDDDHTWERVLPTGAMQLVVNLRDDAIVIRTGSQTDSAATLSGAVWFSHERAGKRAEYKRLLGPTVHFDQPVNAIAFNAAWLDEPLQTGDPRLEAPLEVEAARALSKLEAMSPMFIFWRMVSCGLLIAGWSSG